MYSYQSSYSQQCTTGTVHERYLVNVLGTKLHVYKLYVVCVLYIACTDLPVEQVREDCILSTHKYTL